MIPNPYRKAGEWIGTVRNDHAVWQDGERAGQSNNREAMRCETCEYSYERRCFHAKAPVKSTVPDFGCIHHQPKTKP